VQILLVLHLVARQSGGGDDERRRAPELGRFLRAGEGFEARDRGRPEYVEAPGLGQVVVRRPAREVEQLPQGRVVDRIGTVLFVRAAAPDCVLDVHLSDGTRLL